MYSIAAIVFLSRQGEGRKPGESRRAKTRVGKPPVAPGVGRRPVSDCLDPPSVPPWKGGKEEQTTPGSRGQWSGFRNRGRRSPSPQTPLPLERGFKRRPQSRPFSLREKGVELPAGGTKRAVQGRCQTLPTRTRPVPHPAKLSQLDLCEWFAAIPIPRTQLPARGAGSLKSPSDAILPA